MQPSKSKRRKLTAEQKALKESGVKLYHRKWKQGQKNSWLKKLREIIGKSQVQFAEMIGEPPKTVINIENGRTRLDGFLAHKIQGATGVASWKYMQGRNTPLDFSGVTPYTRKHFDHWKQFHGRNDEKYIADLAERASDTFLLMLRAAKLCGSPKNLLPALELSFHFWCVEAIKNFQLKESLDELLKKERKYIKELTMKYRDWRRPEMDGLRNFYEFKDDPKKPDEAILTLRVDAHAGFSICGDMKVPAGEIKSENLTMR